MQPVSTIPLLPLRPTGVRRFRMWALGYRAPETSQCLAPTRAVSLLLRPRRGPGVAQGHLLKIVLARTRKKTFELADEAATRELADG